jgi:predicted ABC-type ATPase
VKTKRAKTGATKSKRARKTDLRCVVIGGPNGAGKTTFAREFLPKEARIERFVNADLIAAGISPFNPELAALSAGRLFLAEIDRLIEARESFAFESTLSGLRQAERLRRMKQAGYSIEIVFLRLPTAEMAVARVAARVRQGGHNVPAESIRRRFHRGWANFHSTYRMLADAWAVYDNSSGQPELIDSNA